MKTPDLPQRPRLDNLRLALALNVFLPGLGHAFMGRVVRGAVFMAAFLGCFMVVIALFLLGYLEYFQFATGDLINSSDPESSANPFNIPWMIGIATLALVIYFASFVGLGRRPADPAP